MYVGPMSERREREGIIFCRTVGNGVPIRFPTETPFPVKLLMSCNRNWKREEGSGTADMGRERRRRGRKGQEIEGSVMGENVPTYIFLQINHLEGSLGR